MDCASICLGCLSWQAELLIGRGAGALPTKTTLPRMEPRAAAASAEDEICESDSMAMAVALDRRVRSQPISDTATSRAARWMVRQVIRELEFVEHQESKEQREVNNRNEKER